MRNRKLGRTGLVVSEIGYGTWGIGGFVAGASYGETDDSVSRSALRRALERGITFYDTADAYGDGRAETLLGECFGVQGVIVDTHCTRLTNRLGFTKNDDPVKIEQDLMKVWPSDKWTLFSHFMVFHGRAVCDARKPRCKECTLREHCPFPDTAQGQRFVQ